MSENNKLYVIASNSAVALPVVTQKIRLSSEYDRLLAKQLKVGDEFVFGFSDKQTCYTLDEEIILPGVKDKGILCQITYIDENQFVTELEVKGLKIVNILLDTVTIDPETKFVICKDYIDTQLDPNLVTENQKYSELQRLEQDYRQIQEKIQLPPFPSVNYTNQFMIDEVPFVLADLLNCSIANRYKLIEANATIDRFKILRSELNRYKIDSIIESKITSLVSESLERNQREFILREKAKQIHNLLKEFDGDDIVDIYEKRINEHPEDFPQEVITQIKTEISRLKGIPSASQEANLIKTYLDCVMNLPYYSSSKDNDNIDEVIKVLDEDHYGLEKQKDRIIQYLAVKEITNSLKAPIICLYGPPGVGKTSLAVSIARALNRKFVKISLGGVHDESEIRGHRRTYLGALPGKIINALLKTKVNNPLILLDEVDKLRDGGYHGDPASALLEVLDPEQNYRFEDNYVALPFDLSKVMFICTANDISNIPGPLRDRLELIPLYSYTKFEKMEICKKYLIPFEIKENGVTTEQLKFSDEAIDYMIEFYTREAGVRQLRRLVGTCVRKFVVKLLKKECTEMEISIKDVIDMLGKEIFNHDKRDKEDQVGIVNGLAYTDAGGELLKIEVNIYPGKGGYITTGSLGDVMKEACSTSISYIRSHANSYNIPKEFFEENTIHIHFPDTATPKDGPSAGIATTCAILSAICDVKIKSTVAMTGEIDLRGNCMPIGGLREKTMAALREHVELVLCPKENHKDVLELPKEVTEGIKIKEVSHFEDVINDVFSAKLVYSHPKSKKTTTTRKPKAEQEIK